MAHSVKGPQESKEPISPSSNPKTHKLEIPFLGDIIDRIMPTPGSLKHASNSLDNRTVILIKGNHETIL